jgi:type IV pilus assembly protein PilA
MEKTMKRLQQGFTLIELMIVVAIVGILAAIALPAYQDYVVRSKMSEAVAAIAACKTSVSEYLSTKNAIPADITAAGCDTSDTKYVKGTAASLGAAAEIVYPSQATGAGPAECNLTLTPTIVNNTAGNPASVSTWTGASSGCSPKFVPSNFR